ncbi:hypothetical protein LINPERPRIM_LOCUS21589, partial [Linum perenne]
MSIESNAGAINVVKVWNVSRRTQETSLMNDVIKNVDFVAVVSEVNLVASNPREWWIDTGAK